MARAPVRGVDREWLGGDPGDEAGPHHRTHDESDTPQQRTAGGAGVEQTEPQPSADNDQSGRDEYPAGSSMPARMPSPGAARELQRSNEHMAGCRHDVDDDRSGGGIDAWVCGRSSGPPTLSTIRSAPAVTGTTLSATRAIGTHHVSRPPLMAGQVRLGSGGHRSRCCGRPSRTGGVPRRSDGRVVCRGGGARAAPQRGSQRDHGDAVGPGE